MHMPSSQLTVSQAFSQTGIPRRTLQAAIKRGELAARKMGKQTSIYLIEQRDLDDYLASREGVAS